VPLVSQMVSAELGRPVAVDAHPKHAIAEGAAVAAAQLSGAATADTVTVVATTERPIPATAPGFVAGEIPGGGASTMTVYDDVVVIDEVVAFGPLPFPHSHFVDRATLELEDTVPIDLYPIIPSYTDGRLLVTDLDDNTVSTIEDGEVQELAETGRALWPAIQVGEEGWVLTVDGLAVFDPSEPGEVEVFNVGPPEGPLQLDGGGAWMGQSTFTQIDRATHAPIRSFEGDSNIFVAIETPAIIQTELLAFGAMWENGGGGLLRTDLATAAPTTAVISGLIVDIRTDGVELWVAEDHGQVFRTDPVSGQPTAAAPVGDVGPRAWSCSRARSCGTSTGWAP
jgi:hypothetical protein